MFLTSLALPAALVVCISPGPAVPMTKTASGLQYADTVVGTGKAPAKGQTCVVHYTGWLWYGNRKGPQFDSSRTDGEPIEFKVGLGQVIKGWDEGVGTMRVGGKRTLIVPPELGYGSKGAGDGFIPPNATLYFEVELVNVK